MITNSAGYKPHFGGLWAQVNYHSSSGGVRPAMLFLGDCYAIFYGLNESALAISSHTYLLEEDQLLLMSMKHGDDELRVFRWDATEDNLLEIEEENGTKTVWEPVLAEELAEEGYPITVFESYRKSFADNGFAHMIVGVLPLPASKQALRDVGRSKK